MLSLTSVKIFKALLCVEGLKWLNYLKKCSLPAKKVGWPQSRRDAPDRTNFMQMESARALHIHWLFHFFVSASNHQYPSFFLSPGSRVAAFFHLSWAFVGMALPSFPWNIRRLEFDTDSIITRFSMRWRRGLFFIKPFLLVSLSLNSFKLVFVRMHHFLRW